MFLTKVRQDPITNRLSFLTCLFWNIIDESSRVYSSVFTAIIRKLCELDELGAIGVRRNIRERYKGEAIFATFEVTRRPRNGQGSESTLELSTVGFLKWTLKLVCRKCGLFYTLLRCFWHAMVFIPCCFR